MSNIQSTQLRDMLDIAQDEMIMRDRIAVILEQGPKTIPEIAQTMGYSTREVTVWLFGMRRYGLVEEIGRADVDGYFQYELSKEP
jgi:predicted transcriptional regulator